MSPPASGPCSLAGWMFFERTNNRARASFIALSSISSFGSKGSHTADIVWPSNRIHLAPKVKILRIACLFSPSLKLDLTKEESGEQMTNSLSKSALPVFTSWARRSRGKCEFESDLWAMQNRPEVCLYTPIPRDGACGKRRYFLRFGWKMTDMGSPSRTPEIVTPFQL